MQTASTSAKAISSEVYTNQGADYITASGDATTTTLAGGKGLTPSELVETSLAVKSLVTPVQTASQLLELSIPLLIHGGADNDSMTIGAIVGGTAGGGLGADTLIVNGKVTGAEVLMTSKSDPNSSSDKADSLSVVGSMSNSTVYAGAGGDNISVDSHLIAGELFAGSGADTLMVGGSLGGTIEMSDGADSVTAKMLMAHLFMVELRTTPSISPVMSKIPALLVVLA